MISLCVSLYCRRPSNVRRPFLWFFCFHHFSLTHARRRINDIRIIICVDPQVSASSQLPRTYFEATNAFANILKRRKNCFRLYTIGMRSVAREVECTQARRSARSCELYWMSFTFNFVCIWFLFLCNALIALTLARIFLPAPRHACTANCIWWRVMHSTNTHTATISILSASVLRFCCWRCGMYARTQVTCACAVDICCIYTVCFIVTFSICAKTMCRWPLFTDLHRATHKNNTIPFRLLRRLRSGVCVCANRIYPIADTQSMCAMQALYWLFFLFFCFSWIFIFCLFDWEPTMSRVFGALRLICK